MLILDKADFRMRNIFRDMKGHYITIRKTLYSYNVQKDIITLNVYKSNQRTSRYMKQKLTELNGEINKSTIIVRALNIPLSVIDMSSRKKISNNIVDLNSTINQFDVINIYVISIQKRHNEYFSQVHLQRLPGPHSGP